MHKTHLKSYVFKIFLSEVIARPFISLMAKFEVYNVFASKLGHFENDIHFCQDIWHNPNWTEGGGGEAN